MRHLANGTDGLVYHAIIDVQRPPFAIRHSPFALRLRSLRRAPLWMTIALSELRSRGYIFTEAPPVSSIERVSLGSAVTVV